MTPPRLLFRIEPPPELDERAICLAKMFLDGADADPEFLGDLSLAYGIDPKAPKNRIGSFAKLGQSGIDETKMVPSDGNSFARLEVSRLGGSGPRGIGPIRLAPLPPKIGTPAVEQQVRRRPKKVSEWIGDRRRGTRRGLQPKLLEQILGQIAIAARPQESKQNGPVLKEDGRKSALCVRFQVHPITRVQSREVATLSIA
jgi:hypothetical protein